MTTAAGSAELVCTGSELLQGKLNLYAPLFAERLAPLGFTLRREQCCGDSEADIADALKGALRRAGLVLACGGLGPTFDDRTRQAAAAALGVKLRYSRYCAQVLAYNYGLKGRLPENFRNQCLVLEGAKPLENANGTAFGQVFRRGGKLLALLPGPRREWEPMFDSFLAAEIGDFRRLPGLTRLKLRAAGLWEPEAERLLRPVMSRWRGLEFTILAGPATADFIISGDDSAGRVTAAARAAEKALGGRCYGRGEDTPATAAAARLLAAGATLSCAESCTGGLAAKLLTDPAGSSEWFLGGAVAYSNAAKERLLGVKASTLARHGAVSERCALEMAAGARRAFASDYAFSVTGIAGPGGAAPGKPVGLVWFGLAGPRGASAFSRKFPGGRSFVRDCAANTVLAELIKIIK